MSFSNNHKIDPGRAAIIAAVIGAGGIVLGAIIGVIFGAKSQPIQVFLGAVGTPTQIEVSEAVPDRTNATQTPWVIYVSVSPTAQSDSTPQIPTLPSNITVAPRAPIIVTATPNADQQDPPPGSIISAGRSYTKNGVSVALLSNISVDSSGFEFTLAIENQSGRQYIVLYKNSYMHARDDKGKVYHQANENDSFWDKTKQFDIPNGGRSQIAGCCNDTLTGFLDRFKGTIDPSTKYLVFTLDQLVGITNMNWRYDLQ